MRGIKMPFAAQLPDWIVACFRIALLGEIYPDIRAIAIGYDENGSVLIRYYLDRQPTELDLESLGVVAVNFDSLGGKRQVIKKIEIECIHADGPRSELDPLSGFVYFRREFG